MESVLRTILRPRHRCMLIPKVSPNTMLGSAATRGHVHGFAPISRARALAGGIPSGLRNPEIRFWAQNPGFDGFPGPDPRIRDFPPHPGFWAPKVRFWAKTPVLGQNTGGRNRDKNRVFWPNRSLWAKNRVFWTPQPGVPAGVPS